MAKREKGIPQLSSQIKKQLENNLNALTPMQRKQLFETSDGAINFNMQDIWIRLVKGKKNESELWIMCEEMAKDGGEDSEIDASSYFQNELDSMGNYIRGSKIYIEYLTQEDIEELKFINAYI